MLKLMNAIEIQDCAKENGFDSMQFMMISPRPYKGKFIDAYYGMIEIPELGEGFIMLKELINQCGFESLKFIPLINNDNIKEE